MVVQSTRHVIKKGWEIQTQWRRFDKMCIAGTGNGTIAEDFTKFQTFKIHSVLSGYQSS